MSRLSIATLAASLGLAVVTSDVCGQTPAPQTSSSAMAAPPDDDILVPLTPPAPTDDDVLAPLTPPDPTDAEVDAAVARRQREVLRRILDQAEARNADGLRQGLDELGADEVVMNAPEDVAEARRLDLEREAAEARQAEADQRTAARLDRDREDAAAAAVLEEQRVDAERRRQMDEATVALLSDDSQITTAENQVNSFLNDYDGATGNALQQWQRNLLQGSAEQIRLAQCMSTVSESKRRSIAGILSTYDQIIQAVGTAPEFVALQIRVRDDSINGVLAGDCGT